MCGYKSRMKGRGGELEACPRHVNVLLWCREEVIRLTVPNPFGPNDHINICVKHLEALKGRRR